MWRLWYRPPERFMRFCDSWRRSENGNGKINQSWRYLIMLEIFIIFAYNNRYQVGKKVFV